MPIAAPIVVVEKSGFESAILAAEFTRAGFQRGVDYVFVEYPQQLSQANEQLTFVFLGKQWGTEADYEFLRGVSQERSTPVLIASFNEDLLTENNGPCSLHVSVGPGDNRYRWLLPILSIFK